MTDLLQPQHHPQPQLPIAEPSSSSAFEADLPHAFAQLIQQLQLQCSHTQQVATLASSDTDGETLTPDHPALQSFAARIEELEGTFSSLTAALQAEEEALATLRATTLPALRQTNATLQDQQRVLIEAGMEHVVPPARQPLANKSSSSNVQPAAPTSAAKAPSSSTKKASGSNKNKDSSSSSSSSSSTSSSQLHPDRLKLEPVSVEEFSSIPAYMRGRLDRAKLNAGLDAFRALVREKYTLLQAPSAQLTEAQAARVSSWAEAEESSETANHFWVSAEDLRGVVALQALGSINLKAVLVGLRHLGRIRNSTGTGAPRYIVVQ